MASIFSCIVATGIISFIDMMLQTFVAWKKGPKLWVRVAPYIYFINIHTTYLLFPCLNTGFLLYLIFNDYTVFSDSSYTPWCLTFSVFQVLWFIHFFWEVRSGYLLEAKRYVNLSRMANISEAAN
jgi:hypothetical protein